MKTNNKINISRWLVVLLALLVLLAGTACHDKLNEMAENKTITEETDYSRSGDMILPLIGAYAKFTESEWGMIPLCGVRGDDVNAGGLGDQQDFAETDFYKYNKDYWMYNSVWQKLYNNMYVMNTAIEQFELYREAGASAQLAAQYRAECLTLRSFYLFMATRMWGAVYIPETTDPTDLLVTELSSKEEVLQHISDLMDEVIPSLPAVRPDQRTDVKGGVTKFTALAIKAFANLELKNYQQVANATSEIISGGNFVLEPDYYQLFKLKGKLNPENILEYQYSDFGQGAGDSKSFLFGFYGPQGWTPKVAGAGDGWGFWEPSLTYIKFMLDRGEVTRLQTSVLFTPDGIAEIKKDSRYATLPDWISNETPSGDIINNFARALFSSGKHYLPSDQLTPGRTEYGENKNFQLIRYAEILLMHAEAITLGATSSTLSAVEAVNMVRRRAGMPTLSSVTLDDVKNEKLAELALEMGSRYYDLVRYGDYNALSYEGRSFNPNLIYLPYPQEQVDLLPELKGENQAE